MGEKSAANPSRLPLLFTCISLPVLDPPTHSQYSNRKEVVSFLIRTPSNSVLFNPCVATTENKELSHPELATFCAVNGPHVPCWELVLGLQPPYLGSSHSVSKLLCFNITDECLDKLQPLDNHHHYSTDRQGTLMCLFYSGMLTDLFIIVLYAAYNTPSTLPGFSR